MYRVFNKVILEFTGGILEVAKFLGISYQTIYKLRNGKSKEMPHWATCDTLVYKEFVYRRAKKQEVDYGVGYVFNVLGVEYRINHIEEREDDVIYTINNFKLRALKPYTEYNSLYNAVKRRIQRVSQWYLHPLTYTQLGVYQN